MTTTPELLEAMERADRSRAQRASSSMHPSWLDAAALEREMLASVVENSDPFPRHWLDSPQFPQNLRHLAETSDNGIDDSDVVRMPPGTKFDTPTT